MTEFIAASAYFGLVLTIGIYILAAALYKRHKLVLLNPFLLTTVAVILVLVATSISNEAYQNSANFLNYLLVPATVCFAVPIYRNAKTIVKYKWTVAASVLTGAITSITSVMVLGRLFWLDDAIVKSMIPENATTAIAIGISQEIGGIVPITMLAVVVAGLAGNIAARTIMRTLKIQSPIARGLAIGTASHIVGTAKAFEMGRTEGAFASLSIAITGLTLAISIPIIILLTG